MLIFKIVVLLVVLDKSLCVDNSNANYQRESLIKDEPVFGKDWIFFPDGDDKPLKLNLIERDNVPLKEFGPVDKFVTFHLYTRKNVNKSIQIDIDDKEGLLKTPFDRKKKVKFITHGWMSSEKSASCQTIKNAYLKSYNYNVIIVDWKPISTNALYLIPKKKTKKVGEVFAQMIEFLIRKIKVPAKNIHLIGHSLGAHIAGFAGAGLSCGKISRITALDAALPGFLFRKNPEDILDESDAYFVDVIHTCAGALGYYEPLGHVDFYPNGGTASQPGCCCLNEFIEACSHGRAYKYFAESINAKKTFVSLKCESWSDYENGNCTTEYTEMGDSVSRTARGKYFLKTNHKEPFALGYESWRTALSVLIKSLH